MIAATPTADLLTVAAPARTSSSLWMVTTLLAIVVAVGVLLRVYPSANIKRVGVDELFYARNVAQLKVCGILHYSQLADRYVLEQQRLPVAVIPPTRVTFIATGYLCRKLFGLGSIAALHATACLGSILTLLISVALVYRARGAFWAIGFAALMSFAPMQIQAAQRAYIDGFFTFVATISLWLLWEHLKKPDHNLLLCSYGISLVIVVLTKENAAFVIAGIAAVLAIQWWLDPEQIRWRTIYATLAGSIAGVLFLALIVGGPEVLLRIFRLNITKAYQTPYVVQNGDGPWFRYILDLIEMSPLTTLLAIGGLLQFGFQQSLSRFLAAFLLGSYLIMANVRSGMSLRYAEIWDAPLRWFALLQVVALTQLLPRRFQRVLVPAAIAIVCLVDLQQYLLYFVDKGVYDPAPQELLRHLSILK